MRKEELKKMGVSKWDKLRAAVEKGDKDDTSRLIDEIEIDSRIFVDTIFDWIDLLLDKLAEAIGEEAIYPVIVAMHTGRKRVWSGFESEKFSTDAETRARVLAKILTMAHGINPGIKEDEEKYIFTVPCDTGGRLVTKEHFGKTKKAYPWSHFKKDFAYYCVHCVAGFEILHIEKYGYPAWTVSAPEKPGDPCVLTIYKDPEAVPAEYYKSLGMDKDKLSS